MDRVMIRNGWSHREREPGHLAGDFGLDPGEAVDESPLVRSSCPIASFPMPLSSGSAITCFSPGEGVIEVHLTMAISQS
jgi:hypothetical protein